MLQEAAVPAKLASLMKTIADFITHLRLKRDDEAVLIGHIKDCHVSASGPSLDDKCTDRFRSCAQTVIAQLVSHALLRVTELNCLVVCVNVP